MPSFLRLLADALLARVRRVLRPFTRWRSGRLTDSDFRRIVDALPLGVTVKDAEGRILFSNAADAALHGYSPQELLGRPAQTLGATAGRMSLSGTEGRPFGAWQRGSLNARKGGGSFPVHLRSSLVRDRSGGVLGIVTTCEDLGELTSAGERAALEDALTGLASRTLFLELVARGIQRLRRHPDTRFAVLYVNFRRFHLINDSLGHELADRLLAAAARQLKESIRPTDVAARIAGDEFAVLLDGLSELTDATRVAARMVAKFEQPLNTDGRDVYLTPTVGISVSQAGVDDPQQYLKDASLALHRARASEQPFEIFDPVVHRRAVQRVQLETDLRRAIRQEELRPFYQPIVDLRTGGVVALEALARWEHPERGLTLPADFIPVAEETGLVIPIGSWMLRAACAQLATWLQRFPHHPALTVNVNLSVRHLRQPTIVEQVTQTLAETGLPAAHLKVEVTESMLMEDADAQVEVLRRLRAAGVGAVIDDFGTGYSSLSYLQRFPIDALKIDRSFLAHGGGGESWDIVRMIIALAQDKRAQVVAEGVETEEQARRLREMGCDRAQGYLYSRPLPPDAIEGVLAG